MNKSKKYKPYLIVIIFSLLGGAIGGHIGSRATHIIFILGGIMIGILIGIIIALILITETVGNLSGSTRSDSSDSSDTLINNCTSKIRTTLQLRTYAAQRLQIYEFWVQTINIYYSVFTAILAVLSLLENSDFLQVPSAIFTITVAILVTYANAQRFGNRANDLRANCSDLESLLTACALLGKKFPNPSIALLSKNDAAELQHIMDEYSKKLGDSESHSLSDEWKRENTPLNRIKYYGFHIFPLALLILVFFVIPIFFVIYKFDQFYKLFF